MGTSRAGRIPYLDGIRGVAILLVVGHHYNVPGLRSGFIGVDLFFVLSGYLITSLLVREQARFGRIDIPRYYGRRALRLLPALALLLVVWAPLAQPIAVIATVGGFFNWVMAFHWFIASYLGHLWSLSIE